MTATSGPIEAERSIWTTVIPAAARKVMASSTYGSRRVTPPR